MKIKSILVFFAVLILPVISFAATDGSNMINTDSLSGVATGTMDNPPRGASNYINDLFHQSDDPVAGDPQAKVTMVEFLDYQCPYCIMMAPAVDGLLSANKHLRIIFKEFPIDGPISVYAAQMAIAANLQGKFLAFHRAVMALHQHLNADLLLSTAQSVGLDMEKLKQDIKSEAVRNKVKSDYELAVNLDIAGTPAFFFGKSSLQNGASKNSIKFLFGGQDQQTLQAGIDSVSH